MSSVEMGVVEGSRGGRSSVSKAIDVLEALVEQPSGEASLSELSLRVGLSKSTVHRLLTELCAHGLVGRVGVKYCAGIKLAELSSHSRQPEQRPLLTASTPVLEWLFERTGSTVHLGVLQGADVVYLEKLSAAGGTRIPSRVGTRLPASCTAIGKALLAVNGFVAVADAGRIRGPLPHLTPYSIREPRRLADELRGVLKATVAFDHGEAHVGVRCVASPVMVHHRAVAAVSVSTVGPNADPQRFVGHVREASSRIALALS